MSSFIISMSSINKADWIDSSSFFQTPSCCLNGTPQYCYWIAHIRRTDTKCRCWVLLGQFHVHSWALAMIAGVLGQNNRPTVFVTDRELALMNAISDTFPDAKIMLCIWHVKKNILKNCKAIFESNEAWESFIKSWKSLCSSSVEDRLASSYCCYRKLRDDILSRHTMPELHDSWKKIGRASCRERV